MASALPRFAANPIARHSRRPCPWPRETALKDPATSSSFEAGHQAWLANLGNLRSVIRQELVRRQLADHVPPPPARVLDVGCGQGTQTLELARRGHEVVGVDVSPAMLAAFAQALIGEPDEVRGRVELVEGGFEALPALGTFDVVCCHGVLMYLDDPEAALAALAAAVAPGGLLSLLVRNAEGLAMRPGLRGQWREALAAFDEAALGSRGGYRNELGVDARADDVEELSARLAVQGLVLERWYGVRVLNDWVSNQKLPPDDPEELTLLLDAEQRAGELDPYRRLGSLAHLLARRPS